MEMHNKGTKASKWTRKWSFLWVQSCCAARGDLLYIYVERQVHFNRKHFNPEKMVERPKILD